MQFGLDYVSGPSIANLKAAGVAFVCRYLSSVNVLTKVKILTPQEAATLLKADIAIVSNYEWYAERATEGYQSGQQDAQIAASQHHACGGPPDRPIYFSVDMDVQGSQVVNYFNGVHSVLPLSRIGAYGSYKVIKYLLDNHLIAWAWQTYAWSGGQWEPRRHIEQYQNGMSIGGASVDYNHALTADFGQWGTKGDLPMPIPTGWKDDAAKKVLTSPNGHTVHTGFRDCILNADNWAATDVPLEEEHGQNPLEAYFDQPDNYGTQQVFNFTALNYNTTRGVYVMGLGHEFLGLRRDLAAAQAKITDLEKQIAANPGNVALQKELDAARIQNADQVDKLQQIEVLAKI